MTAKTVAIGAALVLVGVLVGLNVPMAEAQRDGPYALSATEGGVWRMNLRTGQVSICGVAMTPGSQALSVTSPSGFPPEWSVPKCSAWVPADGR